MVIWRVIRGFFKGLWRGLSFFNKAVMTLVPLAVTLYLVVIVALAFNQVAPDPIPERAALLINPNAFGTYRSINARQRWGGAGFSRQKSDKKSCRR